MIQDDPMKDDPPLPPRKETFLARYSRRSKLTVTGLALVGLVALSYALGHFASGDGPERDAGGAYHHGPKIHGAETEHAGKKAGGKGTPPSSAAATSQGAAISAVALNKQDDRTVAMASAPDLGLVENTGQGELPRIGEDGRQPWQVYARPYNEADQRPRLAILVADLGLSQTITETAVNRLPTNVTLAFDVQSPAIAAWCARARQEGHETLISVPMEPFDYPRSDPGSHTLLTTAADSANLKKLTWSLKQGTGYVGITTTTGTRFLADTEKLKTVMRALHDRGLMAVDTHISPHSVMTDLAHTQQVPVAIADERIDEDLSPQAIDAALAHLEQTARLNGHALGVVAPLPIVIDHVQKWLKTLPDHGVALAPVSAVAQ